MDIRDILQSPDYSPTPDTIESHQTFRRTTSSSFLSTSNSNPISRSSPRRSCMQGAPRFERLHIDQVKDCRLEDGSYSNINTIKFNADAYSKFSASGSLPHERMVIAIAQRSSFQQPLRKSTSLARSTLSTKGASEACSAVQGSNHIFSWQSKILRRAYSTALYQ